MLVFVLMGLSCYRRCGFLFCELLKGFKSFVILLLISVTVACLITARFNRKNQNTTFSMLRPLFLFCGGEKNQTQTIPVLGNLPGLIFFNPDP